MIKDNKVVVEERQKEFDKFRELFDKETQKYQWSERHIFIKGMNFMRKYITEVNKK